MVLGSGMRDPRSGKNLFRIPDLGVKKAPDPGSGSATLSSSTPPFLLLPRHSAFFFLCMFWKKKCSETDRSGFSCVKAVTFVFTFLQIRPLKLINYFPTYLYLILWWPSLWITSILFCKYDFQIICSLFSFL